MTAATISPNMLPQSMLRSTSLLTIPFYSSQHVCFLLMKLFYHRMPSCFGIAPPKPPTSPCHCLRIPRHSPHLCDGSCHQRAHPRAALVRDAVEAEEGGLLPERDEVDEECAGKSQQGTQEEAVPPGKDKRLPHLAVEESRATEYTPLPNTEGACMRIAMPSSKAPWGCCSASTPYCISQTVAPTPTRQMSRGKEGALNQVPGGHCPHCHPTCFMPIEPEGVK